MDDQFDRQALLPDAALEDVSLPRDRRGNAPQSTAVMLLASYGIAPRTWFASAVLVALLQDLGTTEAGARAVVHRLARRGVLEGRREGRRTAYRVAEGVARSLRRGGQTLVTFAERSESWDGRWTLVAFSVPHGADPERATLRSRLRWRGFAPLFDGLWVSPQEPDAHLEALLGDSPETSCAVFRADRLPLTASGARDPAELWDVEAVGRAYQEFLDRWVPVAERVDAGVVLGAEALRARIGIEEDYRRFVVLDPRLPSTVMPAGWPRQRARSVFGTVFDGLAEPGREHLEAVASQLGTGPLGVRSHVAADLAAGLAVEPA